MKQKNELPLSEPGAYKDLLRRLLFEDWNMGITQ